MSLLVATGLAHSAAAWKTTSLTLEAGTLTCLIGPNGGGKTSLLRALAGIGRPHGEVRDRRRSTRRASARRSASAC